MIAHTIRVEDIEIGERHRALSDDAVTRLAASMKDIGLKQPISVRIVEEMVVDGQMTAGVPVLVAGHHRLAAARSLGWSHIDCIEVDDDALKAELWEIAENLHRLDLTKDQRDEHIRRYAEVLREIEVAVIVPQDAEQLPASVGRPKSITRKVADATGLSDDTVRRALNPRPPVNIVHVREAETDEEAIIREANAIVAAWNRARAEARDLALSQIDAPVFDRSRAGAA